ncbi:thiamine phosphate synthase [Fodinibius salsisoli]|uniref:Thiamine-phosphate synthase n=1 Tax=Fodinibius salsisoli TaxID=2820877 RepID=A0ABT3PM25_9BACT|nr:thiamine phosphate synthase [Fodinibius salsisoli]MCW9706964.1 thiamine phosphate synthase [Fodinibius salsisoli]
MKKKLSGVYLITDTQIQNQYSHVELADFAFKAGVQLVQYRNKQVSDRRAREEIQTIAALDSKEDSLLIVNDRVDLAMAGGADGVHLGQGDLPIPVARELLGDEMVIGGTSSNLGEARAVEEAGADYVALGHIYETSTKHKEYAPRGLSTLRQVEQELLVPLVAIGGITHSRAADVIAAGADLLAVSSAICAAPEPEQAARELVQLFE